MTAKRGRPIGCHCGECRNCLRRRAYSEAKQAKKAKTAPEIVASPSVSTETGENFRPDISPAKPKETRSDAAVLISTSPNAEMPTASELPPETVDWTSLGQEDPDDPDPEERAAQEAAEDYEQRAAEPTFIHSAMGSAAQGLFLAFIAKIEANGYAIPDFEFQGITLTKDVMMQNGATMLGESATRVAVKYLPDMAKPALYDELVVIGMLGGAGTAAAYTSKNPRKLKAPQEPGEEEETVGTGDTSEDFEPARPQPQEGHASVGPALLQVGA